jgi:hypothetical protein
MSHPYILGLLTHSNGAHAAEESEYHPVASNRQQNDAQPHPGKEAPEDAGPKFQALWSIQLLTGNGPQYLVGEKHASNPDDGRQNMYCDSGAC